MYCYFLKDCQYAVVKKMCSMALERSLEILLTCL